MARMVLVRTTVPDERSAHRLAEALVDEGHAACVHVAPTYSVYLWQGRREGQTEWFVEARTRLLKERAVRERMLKDHPYELPLIESMAASASTAYRAWARSVTPPRSARLVS